MSTRYREMTDGELKLRRRLQASSSGDLTLPLQASINEAMARRVRTLEKKNRLLEDKLNRLWDTVETTLKEPIR